VSLWEQQAVLGYQLEKKREERGGASPFITCWHGDGPTGLQQGTHTPVLATLQHQKDLHVAHGAEEAKRSCIPVPETSDVQAGQKQEMEVTETEEDYPPHSPRTRR